MTTRTESLNSLDSEGTRPRAKRNTISHPIVSSTSSIPERNSDLTDKFTKFPDDTGKSAMQTSKHKSLVTPSNLALDRKAHESKSSLKLKNY